MAVSPGLVERHLVGAALLLRRRARAAHDPAMQQLCRHLLFANAPKQALAPQLGAVSEQCSCDQQLRPACGGVLLGG